MPGSLQSPPLPASESGVAPEARPANGDLGSLRTRIDARLGEYLHAQRTDYLRQPVLAALYDDLVEYVCRPGKRLRPTLFLLAEKVFADGSMPADGCGPDLLPAAVSLELLHAFILIHDDIIDRAETRRGLPTLHRALEGRFSSFTDRQRAGTNLALVLGDILFALAQKSLLESSVAPPAVIAKLGTLLLGCMVETGFGEAADIVYGTRDVSKVQPAEIEQMYLLKTTRYTIECPLAMAAVLHGVDPVGLDALARIARPAGLAFQIQNDLMDFARFELSDAEVPADILEGKKTLLMRTAFDLLNETDQGLLQLCFTACGPSEGTVSKARELITKSGAVRRLGGRMDELFAQADSEIWQSDFSPAVQKRLVGLIRLVRDAASSVEKVRLQG